MLSALKLILQPLGNVYSRMSDRNFGLKCMYIDLLSSTNAPGAINCLLFILVAIQYRFRRPCRHGCRTISPSVLDALCFGQASVLLPLGIVSTRSLSGFARGCLLESPRVHRVCTNHSRVVAPILRRVLRIKTTRASGSSIHSNCLSIEQNDFPAPAPPPYRTILVVLSIINSLCL